MKSESCRILLSAAGFVALGYAVALLFVALGYAVALLFWALS